MTYAEARPLLEAWLRAWGASQRTGTAPSGPAAAVEAALHWLPAADRELLAQRYRDGLSWDAIARRTRTSRSTLLARVDRTLFALATLLGVLRLDEPPGARGAAR